MLFALIACFFYRPPLWACIILAVPMVADGLIQRLTAYESTNPRRVVTGALFGYALVTFTIITLIATFRLGVQLGNNRIS